MTFFHSEEWEQKGQSIVAEMVEKLHLEAASTAIIEEGDEDLSEGEGEDIV